MKNKFFLILILVLQTFLSQSQWGIAYNEGWGNRDTRYPNFFSSLDYVGDGINGHRLDIYYPIGMEINLNNIGVLALNKQYEELNKVVKDIESFRARGDGMWPESKFLKELANNKNNFD